jgi:hypothetical protein
MRNHGRLSHEGQGNERNRNRMKLKKLSNILFALEYCVVMTVEREISV